MISRLAQVMIYVNDQDRIVAFWTDVMEFSIVGGFDDGKGVRWVELAPSASSETRIVIHNRDFVAKVSPEVNLGSPSLIFGSNKLESLHDHLARHNANPGEIMEVPEGRVFNFCDPEGNYFAIMAI